MPEVLEVVETKPEDLKAFVDARNKGEQIKKAEPAAQPEAKKADEPEQPKIPRSIRRELNRLREELGAERVRRELAEAAKPAEKAAPKEEVEPQRKDFASDAEYLRATQKWDKAQEAKAAEKTAETGTQAEQYAEHLKAMDEKAVEDIALIPDWDEVQKAAAQAVEDGDAPEFNPAEHPVFMALLAQSDVRAFALHYFAKNPDALEKMLDLTKDQPAQIRAFHRLEGRLEKEYASDKAAQASPEKAKTADTPQKPQGRAEPQQEAKPAKPKPSSEVAARGGSPAPDEPAIGSAAWMLKRNQAQYGH